MNSKTRSEPLLFSIIALSLLSVGLLLLLGLETLRGRQTARHTPTFSPEGFNKILRAARHTRYQKDAPYKVVEFADFECPACRASFDAMNVPGQASPAVTLAFFHVPGEGHHTAFPAAVAAEAAGRQGKFWEMYSLLFATEDTITEQYLLSCGRGIGLDIKRFRKDYKDPALSALVRQDKRLAEQIGITRTPTFLVQNRRGEIRWLEGHDELAEYLNAARGQD